VSRNLGHAGCWYCGGHVRCVEPPRPITRADAGVHFAEYDGMIVAHAECVDCEGKYLAWLSGEHARHGYPKPRLHEDGTLAIGDMSFRSTFNDEDGPADLPTYRIRVERHREPLPVCRKCGLRVWHARDWLGKEDCVHDPQPPTRIAWNVWRNDA
jgi:hypothetical protein